MTTRPKETVVEELWAEFHRELRAFIRRRVEDEATADDLLQETFLRVHDGLDGVAEPTRLAAWVYQIARNLIIDHYRRRPRHAETLAELEHEAETTADDNQIVGGWLLAMIDDLPPRYRQAVRMAEVEGLKQREVADRLGLSLSGAKSRIQRGRERLKKQLRQCCHVEMDRRGNVVHVESRRGCCAPTTP